MRRGIWFDLLLMAVCAMTLGAFLVVGAYAASLVIIEAVSSVGP